MRPVFLFLAFFLCWLKGTAQNNVRAWYANGQVFVVWKIGIPIQDSYAVYASPTAFTNTSNAVLIGRPLAFEYLGLGLKDNLQDTTATYTIPNGQDGLYQLALNEGLFVFTPHQSGSLYFAVTKWGSNSVVAGQNITSTAIPFTYNPAGDPVECHLQRTFPSPFASGYTCFAYMLWADGRQNHWEGRPDFPIMANAAKNGMPGLFLVSAPSTLDTTQAYPLSVWLHGGGGNARQSLAGSRKAINISPEEGILVAQDDKMYGQRGDSPPHPDQPTWHFGWAKNYNPFDSNPVAAANDTVINYTQRRYLWIDQWLIRHFNIDPNRINIHGHSMGSAGSIAMVKCHPQHYGSATIFNTGCAGPESTSSTTAIFGQLAQNLPTNLKNRNNMPVRFYDLWNLYTNCAAERDFPLIKHWHGKNDTNGVMHWGPIVVENYRICDSIGTGIQNHWSERTHNVDDAPDYNDHWIMGNSQTQQTASDNVAFAEERYRSDSSFPAFFNHRLDARNNDPGTGVNGTNNGDGDNWGTWGGYHRWQIVGETQHAWQAAAWLESNAIFDNDNAPTDNLLADLAIRRPQSFKPSTGQTVYWSVKEAGSGALLQSGTTTVLAGNLVAIPQISVYKENIRKVIITVTDGSTAVNESDVPSTQIAITPNPTSGLIYTQADWKTVRILDAGGREIRQWNVNAGSTTLDVSFLPSGLFMLDIQTVKGERKTGKLVRW
ncbi:MAG: T9SS type A sorting domain-containing protein [Saprospiraceae bacterium]|nr:T9SS type A sorting domain-containing protein [Saprospiraceae bacterium]